MTLRLRIAFFGGFAHFFKILPCRAILHLSLRLPGSNHPNPAARPV
jgi:hypothetical protein